MGMRVTRNLFAAVGNIPPRINQTLTGIRKIVCTKSSKTEIKALVLLTLMSVLLGTLTYQPQAH